MIRVEFLGPISRDTLKVDIENLQELSDILKRDDTLVDWLPKCAVALNDTMVSDLDTPLKDGDVVSILPPVCGG